MPRTIVVISIIVTILAVVFLIVGNLGLFPPTQMADTNTITTTSEEPLMDYTHGTFSQYSIIVAIQSEGSHDITFRAVLAQDFQNVAAGTELFSNTVTVEGPGQYRLDGYYTDPLTVPPPGLVVSYSVRVSGSGVTYAVRQMSINKMFAFFGLPLLLLGILLLVISLVRRGEPRERVAPQVIVSPTLGAYGYDGGGSGTAGVGIQQKQSPGRRSGGKKKKKKVKRAAGARPKAGSAPCPFCGKLVPSGSYYCPSCYSKVK
ncbi:MAG: hypothetical protein ACXAEU_11330 [Candidatus Hodarchaeales archaeon]|jgi:hypothetical protein